MKTMLSGLTAFAVAVLTLHHASVPDFPAPPDAPPTYAAQAINAIVGDASFHETFGTAPDATIGEDLRIGTHLAWVLRRLSGVPAAGVPAELRAVRARNLGRLADYIARGTFPRNPASVRGRAPNFLDAQGRICAVGHLVREDLGPAAIAAINRRYQFAHIEDMASAELATWQATSGLTLRELAMIQPAYCEDGTPGCGVVVDEDRHDTQADEIALGTSSIALTAFNLIQLGQERRSAVLGYGSVGIGLLGVSLALRDDSGAKRFDAVTGMLAIVSGFVQATRSRPAAVESGTTVAAAPRVRLGPVLRDEGARALAVQLRF